MFDKLYRRRSVVDRHRGAPLLQSRLRYLQHLASNGASYWTLEHAARMLLLITTRMALDAKSPVTLSRIEHAADTWAATGNPASPLRWRRKAFLSTAKGWLVFEGRLRNDQKKPCPHRDRIAQFLRDLAIERGYSPTTTAAYRWYLETFFRTLGHRRGFSSISIHDVDKCITSLRDQGWKPRSLQSLAYGLRSFFRYGEQKHWCRQTISDSIVGPRIFRQTGLPLGPPWQDVERLLASVKTDRPADIRDRAVLLFLAAYGLRLGEVRRLRLDDIDWENETLTVRNTKGRVERLYPLSVTVGDAILRYLRRVRPTSPYREVFLRLQAPHRPMRHGGMYFIVAGRLARLGISVPHPGPHCLRHACATHLLAEGFSLEEIGGQLGHRSQDATSLYAKVDLATLRRVAALDLGGVL